MVKLIAAIVIMSMLGAAAWFIFEAGVDSCKAKKLESLGKELKADEKKVEYIIQYKDKIKVVYRDKVKLITEAKDPTGCADVKLVDMGFRLLPRSD